MKIELKNLRLYHHLSEETQAYSADLYLDGAHIAFATNDGHGASDCYRPKPPFTQSDLDALEKRIAAEYPPYKGMGLEIPYCLEFLCSDLIQRHSVAKKLARAIKSKAVALVDNQLFQFSYKGVKIISPEQLAKAHSSIIAKYPTAVLLNTLPFDRAVSLVLKSTQT